MNWKLILQLSLLGLVMAFGTVSLIPGTIESFFWITLFIICSYIIAKQCTGRYFLHGFVLSLFNCVWITIAHVGFYTTYVANHPNMATMGASMHILTAPPRLLMTILSPIFGVVYGLFQGLFAFLASKIVKKHSVSVGA
jgi:hypothetical protein